MTDIQLTITYHRFGDYLRVRASSSTPPIAVPTSDGPILYLDRDDPAVLVGCDIDHFSTTYPALDTASIEALGTELFEELGRIHSSSVATTEGAPTAPDSEELVGTVLREPERSLLTLLEESPATGDARRRLLASMLEPDVPGVPREEASDFTAPSVVIRNRFVALKEKLGASLAKTGAVRLDLLRKPVPVAGASFAEPDPSRLPDRFEVTEGGIRVAFVPEGSMFWANGFVPIEPNSGPVSLHITVRLTGEGMRIVQPLPGSEQGEGTLRAHGEVLEDGFFQIHLGSVTVQAGGDALVESCELTFD